MTTEPSRPLATTASGSAGHLGAGMRIKGDISGGEDLQVDGIVEGSIQLEGRKLVIGTSAKITADLVAADVVVYGTVKGNLRARDRVEIKKDGSVVGDVITSRILVEDGAHFRGSIEIDHKASEAGGAVDTPPQARPGNAKAAAKA